MGDVTIVTGGAGFIGSHLVDLLVASGERVRVVERPGANVSHLGASVEVVFTDIRDRRTIGPAMVGAGRVYHLAANPNLWARDRGEFDAVNHHGTVNVLDAALAAGASRVLHTSTESILTKACASGPIDENVEITLEDTVGPYCASKLRAEQYAFALAAKGRPVVVANPTMPVGPGDRGMSPPTALIRDLCLGKLPALMDCTLNVIDVRDAAKGLWLVMENGQPGRRYLLGGANLTLTQFAGILAELTGMSAPRWRVPYGVGLAVAIASEYWADHVSGRMPKASVTGVRLARRIMHFDAARSLAEIGLRPREVRLALVDAIQWLMENAHIPETARSQMDACLKVEQGRLL